MALPENRGDTGTTGPRSRGEISWLPVKCQVAEEGKRDCFLGITGKKQIVKPAELMPTPAHQVPRQGGHEAGMMAPSP